MFPNGAPWLDILSHDIIVAGIVLIILATLVLLREQIGAILNSLVARPIYLLRLHVRGVQEWQHRHHSPEYIEAQYAHV